LLAGSSVLLHALLQRGECAMETLLPRAIAVFVACSGAAGAPAPHEAAWSALVDSSPMTEEQTIRALQSMAAETEPAEPAISPTDNPLKLTLFDAATVAHFGAYALDGSPAGYYYREGRGEKDSFVFYLQGGGLCVLPTDCAKRAKGPLGSSTHRPLTMSDGSNVFSSAPFNPFSNWSHVYVPYLTGDVHIGTDRAPNLQGFYFSGHNILEAIVSKLLNETSLRNASRVLLAGGSAGGIGTFANADWLGSTLRAHHSAPERLVYRAHPQAGAYFVNRELAIFPEMAPPIGIDGNLAPLASAYLYLWFKQRGPPPFLDQSCMAAHSQAPHQCWSAAVHYAYVETPLYVAQNMYDSNQAGSVCGLDWWPLPKGQDEHAAAVEAYKVYFGNQTVHGIGSEVLTHGAKKTPQDGLFIPSCWMHTGNLCMQSTATKVRGWTLAASLADWFAGGSAVPHTLVDDCVGDGPCNSNCHC